MKSLLAKSIFMLLLGTAFIACTKGKQEILTQGEEVTSRSQGNGVMETVQKGPNGNTTVFSNWILKTEPDWTGFGTGEISTDFNTTSLTSAIMDNGLVLVYYMYGDVVKHLPTVSLPDFFVIDYSFLTGKITVKIRYSGGGAISGVADFKFRYILISSSSFGGGPGNGRTASVDYNDYNAVCDYYGIAK